MSLRPNRNLARQRRHDRIRKKVGGTTVVPRLNVFRSLRHVYAQLVDDQSGCTLVAVSTLDPEVKEGLARSWNVDAARKVGEILAQRALTKGISRIVFDRGGYVYHGRVAAVADGARNKGLIF
ncbi:MAG: 50S ribosomal protein L18 [Firmicutes bacterium]|nr:50S ribosomal protein L18 [Bacillota bacterium]